MIEKEIRLGLIDDGFCANRKSNIINLKSKMYLC